MLSNRAKKLLKYTFFALLIELNVKASDKVMVKFTFEYANFSIAVFFASCLGVSIQFV